MARRSHAILLSAHHKSKLEELRWTRKSPSMAATMRDIVEEYASGSPDPSEAQAPTDIEFRFDLGDGTWERVQARAAAEGKAVSAAIRERLDRLSE